MTSLSSRLVRLVSLAAGTTLVVWGWAQTPPQKSVPRANTKLIYSIKGPDLYGAHCAACHGADAKGNGPVAPVLKVKMPDLTTITQRNRGKFPAERVRKIISGDETLAAHGSREMPIWGPIFHQIEQDQDWGEPRLTNLVNYLQSIQR